jgi:hypothetical protein
VEAVVGSSLLQPVVTKRLRAVEVRLEVRESLVGVLVT